MQVPTDTERGIAAEIARQAMVAGWSRAIRDAGIKNGMSALAVEGILNAVEEDNSKRDPSARIDELRSWGDYKRDRIDLRPKPGSSLHKLSPGLRAYMEKKLSKATGGT